VVFTKYLRAGKYLRAARFYLNRLFLQHVDRLTAPPYDSAFKHPPIFLLGAPRCGSTLVCQVITDAFDVAYLSNRHCQFFGAPALAERIFKPLKNKKPSDYTSDHGQTKGWDAPSECGEWWYRFFRRSPAYVTLDDVVEAQMYAFRRSLLALTEAAGKPVVFKNLYAALRLQAIAKHIPEALFVVLERNERDTAHSILEGRLAVLGGYDQWWSVPPPNVQDLKLLDPVRQVVGQIRGIHSTIEKDIGAGATDRSRVLVLEYERFCADVHDAVHRIETFLSSHGIAVGRRFEVPQCFSPSSGVRIDTELYSRLEEFTKESV